MFTTELRIRALRRETISVESFLCLIPRKRIISVVFYGNSICYGDESTVELFPWIIYGNDVFFVLDSTEQAFFLPRLHATSTKESRDLDLAVRGGSELANNTCEWGRTTNWMYSWPTFLKFRRRVVGLTSSAIFFKSPPARKYSSS
jgi:hypothetical protein